MNQGARSYMIPTVSVTFSRWTTPDFAFLGLIRNAVYPARRIPTWLFSGTTVEREIIKHTHKNTVICYRVSVCQECQDRPSAGLWLSHMFMNG